jgi:hypothetical protein
MENLVNCPTCKGTGKISITFSELGSKKPPEIILINCRDCDGAKQVTPQQAKSIIRFTKEYENAWCKCGNPSKRSNFHPNGIKNCSKHCYTCADCKKITQIG